MTAEIISGFLAYPLLWAEDCAHVQKAHKGQEALGCSTCFEQDWPLFQAKEEGTCLHMLSGMLAFLILLPYTALLSFASLFLLLIGLVDLCEASQICWYVGGILLQLFFFNIYMIATLPAAYSCLK